MRYFKTNINPLTGIKTQTNCTFKTKNPFPEMIVKHQYLGTYHTSSHNVRYGLNTKLLIAIISSIIMLSFFWWLNNSNASIPIVSTPISPKLTLKANTSLISIPIKISPKLSSLNPNEGLSQLPWLHLRIKSGDTLSSIFKKNNLNQLYKISQTEYSEQLRKLKINQELHIRHDANNIKDLILVLNKTDELHIFQTETKEFTSEIRPIGRTTKIVSVHGIVETTLLAAAKQAGLSKQQLDKYMNIFIQDVDFKRDIKIGDRFIAVYKQYHMENNIEEGPILAAEIINKGKVHQALRYTDKTGHTEYYTPTGASLKKISLLTAPVASFKRVSSYFGVRRHPISGRKHLHTGIDYSASHGTPIMAAGDAKVKFLGRKGGYGKVIVLEHDLRIQTLYAHMSKFSKNLKVGSEVSQGEFIGYVGKTGKTTGSHLHYEVLIDNKHKNPLDFKTSFSLPILTQSNFLEKTKKMLAQLSSINKSSTKLAHVSTLNNVAGITR